MTYTVGSRILATDYNNFISSGTVINGPTIPTAILTAAVSPSSTEATLFKNTLIGSRPLADINNTGTVTSADSLAYNKWVQSATQPADEVLWIEGTMNPYMLSNAATYSAYLTGNVGGINSTWNSTYGQTALTPVSANAKVTATSWASLVNTLSTQAAHQATAITARTAPQTGNLIAILSSLQTDITNTYNNRYNAYATGTQYTAWTGTNSKTTDTVPIPDNDAWTLTFTNTVTFASTTAANYFFGAGGLIKLQFSKLSTGYDNDVYWNNFIPKCGDIYLSATGASKTIAGVAYTGTTRIGGTGAANILATGTGYAQLTGSPTTIFELNPTDYLYTSSYVRVQASVSGSVLTMTTTWFQQARNPGPYPAVRATSISGGSATSGGTFGTAPATLCTYFPPETTYLTNTWGTPTVAASVVGPTTTTLEYTTPGTFGYTLPANMVGNQIEVVIVGGGGGGADAQPGADEGGGGGGAGGYINRILFVDPGSPVVIVVGRGGGLSADGGASQFIYADQTITALGGGGGKGSTGANGGSGGGAGGAGGTHSGGAGLQPSQPYLSAGLGNNGGACPQSDNFPGGGGGGALGAGGVGGSNNGGAPIANPIVGSTVGYNISGTYYLAGGGSGRYISQPHLTYTAGSGYGGDGSWGYPSKADGTPGASGCVIIQFDTQ